MKPNEMYEDDLMLFLGMESIEEVTCSSRIQIGEAIFHSKAYQRVGRRNTFTVSYFQEQCVFYGEIKVFFLMPGQPDKAGAVISPMLAQKEPHITDSHEVLGTMVSHILAVHPPKRTKFDVIPLDNIIDICIVMKFSDIYYISNFPNHLEKD